MKLHLIGAAVLACASVAVSGCAPLQALTSGGSSSVANDAVKQFLTDPNCAHNDELHVAIGPVSTGTLDLKRSCAGPTQGAVTTGAIVGGSSPAPAPGKP